MDITEGEAYLAFEYLFARCLSIAGGLVASAIGVSWTIGLCGVAVFAVVVAFWLTGSPGLIRRGLGPGSPLPAS